MSKKANHKNSGQDKYATIISGVVGSICDESKDASIFGAELKNGKQLCANYFKRRDRYE